MNKRAHQLKPVDFLVLLGRKSLREKTVSVSTGDSVSKILRYKNPFPSEGRLLDPLVNGSRLQRAEYSIEQSRKAYYYETVFGNSLRFDKGLLEILKIEKQARLDSVNLKKLSQNRVLVGVVNQKRLLSRYHIGEKRTVSCFTSNKKRTFVSYPRGQSWFQKLKESLQRLATSVVNYIRKLPKLLWNVTKQGLTFLAKNLWAAVKNPKLVVEWYKTAREWTVDFVKHFWTGCKLLAADVRVSYGILKRATQGKPLSRRERNLLVGTGADLARLIPFSFFVIVPFMEFALPFALKLFPNMIPSQFQDRMKKEEELKKQLKLRLEMARYLQDVVEEKAKKIKSSSEKDSEIRNEAEELTRFLQQIRSGKSVERHAVLHFSRLFSDEITLEGLNRPQLVAMCRYMGISPQGSDNFLRYRLRARLNSIKNDDMQIMWEGGVSSLTDEEVVKACRDRGIRTAGVSMRQLRQQLEDWLELSQNKEVPSSLMILSRAFFYTEVPEEALKETLSSMPDNVLDDIRYTVSSSSEKHEMTSEERLAEVRRQERLLQMEREREARMDTEKKKKVTTSISEAAAAVAAAKEEARKAAESAKAVANRASQVFQVVEDVTEHVASTETSKASSSAASSSPQTAQEHELEHKESLLASLARSFEDLIHASAVEDERLELEQIKAELREAESKLSSALDDKSKELSSPEVKRLKTFIAKLEKQLESADEKLGIKLKLLDLDNDGVMDISEVKEACRHLATNFPEDIVEEAIARLDKDEDGKINRDDIKRLVRETTHVGAESVAS
ncbi:calcium-binding EF hand family protein isoform 2 [Galdieria sulphuraria]|uniref:Mitochondrial proton/calcium exchanger protein n=1 Tax=Galdieria sulphuraria TaxID=130081 RepID=M2XWT6_GALSU|nr:calcium-binding EF hand family protein isoform 2 [Galdieria sulphuraria]EME28093.1 calcium-binding EF hand family protein isoform 2 [Galdieria sulphuraria]|eukprot:XP_005704613.1 calcium-binding EF hand family protein isoform 2 [Galdieria sulphuraria]